MRYVPNGRDIFKKGYSSTIYDGPPSLTREGYEICSAMRNAKTKKLLRIFVAVFVLLQIYKCRCGNVIAVTEIYSAVGEEILGIAVIAHAEDGVA